MSTAAEPTTPATADRPKASRFQMDNMLFETVLYLNNPDTVKGFQVQQESLSEQIRRIQSLEQRIQIALTTPEKDALAKVKEQEVKDLQSKDALFQKVFGISSMLFARPHKIVPTKIQTIVPVSDEDLTKAREDKEFKESAVMVRDNAKFLHAATMTGEVIFVFDRDLKVFHANREHAIQLKAQSERLAPGEEKTKIEEAFAAAEKKFMEDHAIMMKTYGISPMRPFRTEALEAVFAVALTKEEAARQVPGEDAPIAKAVEAKKDKPAAKAN